MHMTPGLVGPPIGHLYIGCDVVVGMGVVGAGVVVGGGALTGEGESKQASSSDT